jgi:hypothetical protein
MGPGGVCPPALFQLTTNTGRLMSKRTNRSGYPEYVRYVTRFNPGDIQRATGLPASLVYKARRGDVERFSEKSLSKFREVYNRYWENRLDKAGVTPDNWNVLIRQSDVSELRETVKGIEKAHRWDRRLERGGVNPDEREILLREKSEKDLNRIIDKNYETAKIIVERRRVRDKNLPGYSDSWHTVNDILKQMARDLSRLPSDWSWIAKYGSPKRRNKWVPDTRKSRKRGRQYEH